VIATVKKSVKDTSNLITQDNRIDLKGVNARQLTEIGIPAENIDICPFCTSCRSDLFYSYRKENGTDKRHNAIIKLKRATA
jgi:copper oxidase (laccase) domain-containing protein